MTNPKNRIAEIKTRLTTFNMNYPLGSESMGVDFPDSSRQDIPWLVEQLEQRDGEIERLKFEMEEMQTDLVFCSDNHYA